MNGLTEKTVILLKFTIQKIKRSLLKFYSNPVNFITLFLISSSLFAIYKIYIPLCITITLTLLCIPNNKNKLLAVSTFILIITLQYTLSNNKINYLLNFDNLVEKNLTILVETNPQNKNYKSEFIGYIKDLETKLLIVTKKYNTIKQFDNLIAKCNLKFLSPYDSNNFNLISKNVYLVCELVDYTKLDFTPDIFYLPRHFIKSAIYDNFDIDTAGIILGLTTGDKTLLSKNIYEIFQNTGIAHILTVSGLHFGILAGFVFFILNILNYRIRILVVVLVGFIFYGIVGFSNIPTSRAFFLLLIFAIGSIFGRKFDAIHTTNIILSLSLIHIPEVVMNVSFVLTFGITYSILLFFNKIKIFLSKSLYISKIIINYLSLQTSILIALIPISIIFFGKSQFIGIISNVFANIYIIYIYPIIGVWFLSSFFSISLAKIFTNAIETITKIFLEIIKIINDKIGQESNLILIVVTIFLMFISLLYANRKLDKEFVVDK